MLLFSRSGTCLGQSTNTSRTDGYVDDGFFSSLCSLSLAFCLTQEERRDIRRRCLYLCPGGSEAPPRGIPAHTSGPPSALSSSIFSQLGLGTRTWVLEKTGKKQGEKIHFKATMSTYGAPAPAITEGKLGEGVSPQMKETHASRGCWDILGEPRLIAASFGVCCFP